MQWNDACGQWAGQDLTTVAHVSPSVGTSVFTFSGPRGDANRPGSISGCLGGYMRVTLQRSLSINEAGILTHHKPVSVLSCFRPQKAEE